MKYIAETEKAVKLTIVMRSCKIDKSREYQVWVPKSQLAEDGVPGEWITSVKAEEVSDMMFATVFSAWHDADGNSFQPSKTAKELERANAREQKFEAGKKAYEELIAKAKAAGVKGIRVGMRRATIEAKLAAAVA